VTGSVVIFYTVDIDSEIQRYEAYAVAINAAGHTVKVDINDIVRASATLWDRD